MAHPGARAVAGIVAAYLLAGALWALASDAFLLGPGADAAADAHWSIANRLLFVLVTAALLAALLRRAPASGAHAAAAPGHSDVESLALFDANPLPMWVYDTETLRFLAINDAAVANYGWTREEFLAMTVQEIRPAEEVPRLRAMLARAAEAPVVNFGQARHRRRNGTLIDVQIASHPIRFAGRRARLVLAQDISGQVRAQAALAASERRYRAIFEQAVAGVGELGIDGRWLDANDRLCKILGYERDELLRLNFRDTTPPEDADALFAQMCRVRDGEIAAYATEKRCVRKGGALAWSRLSLVPLREDGETRAFIVVIEDITERKRIADELRILSLAIEQSEESIVITDLDGRIEYTNAAFTRVSGYARDELVGSDPRILKSGRTPRATYEDLWRTLRRGETWKGEFVNRRKDGTEYVEEAVISPVRQEDGRVIKYLAVKQDVTERRRLADELQRHQQHLEELVAARTRQLEDARQQAEAASRAKSAFLATMSHEIRTPMNGVLGLLEVLARDRLSARQRELLSTARDSAHTLLTIIDDILDFSKIEAGRLQLEVAPVTLAESVEALAESMVPMALRREVDLSVFVDPELPAQVLTDGLRLRQILFNLVGNAIKFSAGRPDKRGRVWVRATRAAETREAVTIAVIDNGIGMSEQTLQRLFTPFTQADASTTRRFGGSGLGLAICKRLVAMLRGTIAVQSRLGEGSTFAVTLPCAAENAPAPAPFDLSGITCVLVASAALDSDGLRAYLEHAGAQVHTVETATEIVTIATRCGGPVVAMVDVGWKPPAAAAPAPTAPNLRCVLLARGLRRRLRPLGSATFALDALAIRRHALLRAVAIAAARSNANAGADAGPEAPALPRLRPGAPVLVAEDDEVNRLVIDRQLALLGVEVEFAVDGAAAFERWQRGHYAMLLTDLHMPVMDGWALAQAVRQAEAQRGSGRTPIVALTANAVRGEEARARAAGIDDFLTKPLSLAALAAALERWLPAGRPLASAAAAPAAPQTSAAAPLPVLDVAALAAVVGNDPAAIRSLLQEFLEVAVANAAALETADAADPGRVVAIAHKLKSAARSVGAIALGALCADLEQAGRAGDTAAVSQRLAQFGPAWASARDAIRAALGETAVSENA
jgi:PAS domain S-box-containing protein